jgi:uncharacterized phage-associated protein/DNA-binding XRE family transcriptional regulator
MSQAEHASTKKRIPYEEGMARFRAAWSPAGKQLAEDLDFASRLRATRKALGLTQEQVAEITGEDQADISRMERGRLNPSVRRAERAMAALQERAAAPSRLATAVVSSRPLMAVDDAAKYLLSIQDAEDGITALKLQKLLYYAQGYALALLGQPLFRAPIKAWGNGPVVPGIWQRYRKHQANPIPAPDDFDVLSPSTKARAILDRVYGELGWFTAARLRNMTHEERPWMDTHTTDDESPEIPRDLLTDYFSERLAGSH